MIKEDYVSFKTTKLLKEKGFEGYSILYYYDEEAANTYIKERKEKHLPYNSDDPKFKEFYYTQPTLQMASKWLREVHNLFIQIVVDFSDGAYPMYNVYVVDLARGTSITVNGYDRYSYKQACETAIKYCLENLI